MHLDVRDLKNFYDRTALGRAARRALRSQLCDLWPVGRCRGEALAGYGYATPLLGPYLEEAGRVINMMPGPQGVLPWPAGRANVSLLCEETLWPLANETIDRLVILHGLETSEHPAALLEESYRILKGGGRAIFIVPNRAGLWARRDRTPFGFGRPYSLLQLESLLRDFGFVPEHHRSALFFPPSERRFWLRTGAFWENAGRRLPSYLAGGVLIVEAGKQVPAPRRPGLPERVRLPFRVLEGVKAKGPRPA